MLEALVAAGWLILALAMLGALIRFLVVYPELFAAAFVILSVLTIVLAIKTTRGNMPHDRDP